MRTKILKIAAALIFRRYALVYALIMTTDVAFECAEAHGMLPFDKAFHARVVAALEDNVLKNNIMHKSIFAHFG